MIVRIIQDISLVSGSSQVTKMIHTFLSIFDVCVPLCAIAPSLDQNREKDTDKQYRQFLVIVVVTQGRLNKTISFHIQSYTIRPSDLLTCCLVCWPIQESDPIFLALFISAKFAKFTFVKM